MLEDMLFFKDSMMNKTLQYFNSSYWNDSNNNGTMSQIVEEWYYHKVSTSVLVNAEWNEELIRTWIAGTLLFVGVLHITVILPYYQYVNDENDEQDAGSSSPSKNSKQKNKNHTETSDTMNQRQRLLLYSRLCGGSALANGLFHAWLGVWCWKVGDQLEFPPTSDYHDLSLWKGPFSDPGLCIQNGLVAPIALLWLWWGRWILLQQGEEDPKETPTTAKMNNHTPKRTDDVPHYHSSWKRYIFPIVFLMLGWIHPDVYPSFFQSKQYEWPFLYTLGWVGIFWSETGAAVCACLCIIQSVRIKKRQSTTQRQ